MPQANPGACALTALGLTLASCLALPAPAFGHAELRASEPAEGAALHAAPDRIVLAFTEPMQVTSLRLLDEAGRDQPLRREGTRTARAGELRAAVAGPLPPGGYRIEYRGLSADGHVGGGAVRFRVEAGTR